MIAAAGIDCASAEEDAERRGDLISLRPIAGRAPRRRVLAGRASPAAPGTIEADQLNGEIVLLGRLHGVPTPVNALLQVVAHELARGRRPAGLAHRGRPPGSPRLSVSGPRTAA